MTVAFTSPDASVTTVRTTAILVPVTSGLTGLYYPRGSEAKSIVNYADEDTPAAEVLTSSTVDYQTSYAVLGSRAALDTSLIYGTPGNLAPTAQSILSVFESVDTHAVIAASQRTTATQFLGIELNNTDEFANATDGVRIRGYAAPQRFAADRTKPIFAAVCYDPAANPKDVGYFAQAGVLSTSNQNSAFANSVDNSIYLGGWVYSGTPVGNTAKHYAHAVYNRQLSSTEIAQMYAYWRRLFTTLLPSL